MGRKAASAFDRACAKTWTRYLLKSLQCDVRWLNQTLLFPLYEMQSVLRPGLAPQVFEGIHFHGHNPNGKYFREFDDSGTRYNLRKRTCARVPRSREWLFREVAPYVNQDVADIDHTRTELAKFLEQRKLRFVLDRAIYALRALRPAMAQEVERVCIANIVKAATPSSILLALTFFHEMVWSRRTEAIIRAKEITTSTIEAFGDSLVAREFDDASQLVEELCLPLDRAVARIAQWGDRSAPTALPSNLYFLPDIPLLAADSEEVENACRCLHAAGEEFYECILTPLPSPYQAAPGAMWSPTEEAVDLAAKTLCAAVVAATDSIASEYTDNLHVTPHVPTYIQQRNVRSDTGRLGTRPASGAPSRGGHGGTRRGTGSRRR